ncbi:hypothetical protein Pmar_PMAR019570, partial [Perkinsus marinus ATCC 50983]
MSVFTSSSQVVPRGVDSEVQQRVNTSSQTDLRNGSSTFTLRLTPSAPTITLK